MLGVNKILVAASAVVTLSGALGVAVAVDNRYAKTAEFRVVAEDLRRHKIEVRMKYLQERMWDIESYWRAVFKEENGRLPKDRDELLDFMPKETAKTWREYKDEYDDLKRELDNLDKKERKG